MSLRQFIFALVVSLGLLALIIRLIQKGRLDIAYCWLWFGIGLGTLLVVVRYEWLLAFSRFIGAVTPTTTLFLLAILAVLLLSLQYSLVISAHRRQIKRLAQHMALLREELDAMKTDEDGTPKGKDA